MTVAEGMLGLSGFGITCFFVGEITRSMSSMGTAPRRTRSPRTNAPEQQPSAKAVYSMAGTAIGSLSRYSVS